MKEFNKKDLKYGMVVETKSGRKYMYNYRKEFVSLSGCSALDSDKHYANDLTAKIYCHEEFDIIKVYQDYTCQEVLWERKEIELSDHERSLLGALPCEFKYIARDKSGDLFVFDDRPVKYVEYSEWVITGRFSNSGELKVFNHLFQFIKWEDEEPYYIPDLFKLKG